MAAASAHAAARAATNAVVADFAIYAPSPSDGFERFFALAALLPTAAAAAPQAAATAAIADPHAASASTAAASTAASTALSSSLIRSPAERSLLTSLAATGAAIDASLGCILAELEAGHTLQEHARVLQQALGAGVLSKSQAAAETASTSPAVAAHLAKLSEHMSALCGALDALRSGEATTSAVGGESGGFVPRLLSSAHVNRLLSAELLAATDSAIDTADPAAGASTAAAAAAAPPSDSPLVLMARQKLRVAEAEEILAARVRTLLRAELTLDREAVRREFEESQSRAKAEQVERQRQAKASAAAASADAAVPAADRPDAAVPASSAAAANAVASIDASSAMDCDSAPVAAVAVVPAAAPSTPLRSAAKLPGAASSPVPVAKEHSPASVASTTQSQAQAAFFRVLLPATPAPAVPALSTVLSSLTQPSQSLPPVQEQRLADEAASADPAAVVPSGQLGGAQSESQLSVSQRSTHDASAPSAPVASTAVSAPAHPVLAAQSHVVSPTLTSSSASSSAASSLSKDGEIEPLQQRRSSTPTFTPPASTPAAAAAMVSPAAPSPQQLGRPVPSSATPPSSARAWRARMEAETSAATISGNVPAVAETEMLEAPAAVAASPAAFPSRALSSLSYSSGARSPAAAAIPMRLPPVLDASQHSQGGDSASQLYLSQHNIGLLHPHAAHAAATQMTEASQLHLHLTSATQLGDQMLEEEEEEEREEEEKQSLSLQVSTPPHGASATLPLITAPTPVASPSRPVLSQQQQQQQRESSLLASPATSQHLGGSPVRPVPVATSARASSRALRARNATPLSQPTPPAAAAASLASPVSSAAAARSVSCASSPAVISSPAAVLAGAAAAAAASPGSSQSTAATAGVAGSWRSTKRKLGSTLDRAASAASQLPGLAENETVAAATAASAAAAVHVSSPLKESSRTKSPKTKHARKDGAASQR